MKPAEQDAKDASKDSPQPAENKNGKEANAAVDKTDEKESEKKDVTAKSRVDSSRESAAEEPAAGLKEAVPERDRNQNEEGKTTKNVTEHAA